MRGNPESAALVREVDCYMDPGAYCGVAQDVVGVVDTDPPCCECLTCRVRQDV